MSEAEKLRGALQWAQAELDGASRSWSIHGVEEPDFEIGGTAFDPSELPLTVRIGLTLERLKAAERRVKELESSMPDRPPKRGGSDSARLRGDRNVTVSLSPAEYAAVAEAAKKAGRNLKGYCRTAVLAAVGIKDTRKDLRRGGDYRSKKARGEG